jgi:TonB family protein
MRHFRGISLALFLSLFFHTFFIYALTVYRIKKVDNDGVSILYVAIVQPERESERNILRTSVEPSHPRVIKRAPLPLKPVKGLTMVATENGYKPIQSHMLVPRIEPASKRSQRIKPKSGDIPMVFAERETLSMLQRTSFSPEKVFGEKQGMESRKSAQKKVAGYAEPTLWLTTTTIRDKSSYQSQREKNGDTIKLTSYRKASEPTAVNDHNGTNLRFHTMVIGKIENAKIYPEVAKRIGIEGDVFVRFTILPDGEVGEIELLQPVKLHTILKKAAIKTIRDASPYLPIPPGMKSEEILEMKVKISYKLN